MKKNKDNLIYILFTIIYAFFLSYNIIKHSQWAFDAGASLILLGIFYWINKWTKINTFYVLLFNLALLFHNLGSFGAFELRWHIIEYDNFLHFFSSFAAALIIAKIFIKINYNIKFAAKTRYNKYFTSFLIISVVIFLGILLEVTEFIGYSYLGFGDGLFFFGYGDANQFQFAGEYFDVMTDIISNLIGAAAGIITFYIFSE